MSHAALQVADIGVAEHQRPSSVVLGLGLGQTRKEPRWRESRVLIVDTETTGINVKEDRVVELGAVYYDQGVRTGTRKMRINPGCPIPEEASKIHGIFDEHVRDKPTFSLVAPRFLAHLDGSALSGPPPFLAGYNVSGFDIPLLNTELRRAGIGHEIQLAPVLDLMIFVRWHHRSLRSRSLASICAHYCIPLFQAHSAVADAAATGALMLILIEHGLIPEAIEDALCQQARFARQIEEEWRRWSYWIYADRQDGRLRLGAGRHIGDPLDSVEADYLYHLLSIPDLPDPVRTLFQQHAA